MIMIEILCIYGNIAVYMAWMNPIYGKGTEDPLA